MYNWKRATLTNGIRLASVEAPHLHAVMMCVYVHAGCRHEHPKTNGVSHYLEHLFFRGCERYPDSKKLNAAVENVGGSLNGVTTRDHGCYYTIAHPGGLRTVLDVTGDMLARPLLAEQEVEREVILEEILDEVDEQGRIVDIDTISKKIAFGSHPLGLPVAGDERTVRAITSEDLWRHHSRFYGGCNLAVCVAGPVGHQEVLEHTERAFALIPRGKPVVGHTPPMFSRGPLLEHVEHRESQSEVRLAFPARHERHPDYPAQVLLNRILDDGLTSRLQQEIVEKRGLAYDVEANVDGFEDAALLEIDAISAHAKVPELLSRLATTLVRLTREPPSEEELKRAKIRQGYGFDFMQDSVDELAGWFGLGELKNHPLALEERLATLNSVRAEDIRRVAADLLTPERLMAVVVGLADESDCRRAIENAW